MSAMGAASTPALGWNKIVNLFGEGMSDGWVGGTYLAAAEADCDDA